MERLRKRNEGSALIFVMCILCVFMAAALIMILVSYQVLTNAQQSAVKDQCRISAVSFNKLLEKEITAPEGQGIRDDNIRYFLYDQIKTISGSTTMRKRKVMAKMKLSALWTLR